MDESAPGTDSQRPALPCLAPPPPLHARLQTHLLFTDLCQQLDSLASAAVMVASSILKDHHHHHHHAATGAGAHAGAAAPGAEHPEAGGAAPGSGPPRGGARSRQAEARRVAFVRAAFERCVARLGGVGPGPGVGPAAGGGGGSGGGGGGGAGAGADEAAAVRRRVDTLIAAATRAENLSRMFEGWAAWL
jgi:hypothetical protein